MEFTAALFAIDVPLERLLTVDQIQVTGGIKPVGGPVQPISLTLENKSESPG